MDLFQNLIDNLPSTLAFQDALSNSVSGGGGAGGTGATPGGTTPTGQTQNPFQFMWILIVGMLFLIVFTSMSGRREKKRRAAMLAAIKKGDRVLTIGGLIGTVAELRDDEVALRIDENSNVKMRFTRAAIQQVLKESPVTADDTPGGSADPGGADGGGGGRARAVIEAKQNKTARAAR